MNNTATKTNSKFTIQQIAMIAVMTAVTCVLAPLSVPIGPVPISLTNLVIYFSLFILGTKKGTDELGFGNCTNTGACAAECPKNISLTNIARLNREFICAKLKD